MTLLAPEARTFDLAPSLFQSHMRRLAMLADSLADTADADVQAATDILVDCLRGGRKVLACGNGGSAADAQHFVAELVGRMLVNRPSLPAISLTTDTSILTAIGNDYGYDLVFSRQVEALGRPGDVLVALSTSGHSPNVLAAIKAARTAGMGIISLTGNGGGAELALSDVWLQVGSVETPHTQELHTAILHSLCIAVEQTLFG